MSLSNQRTILVTGTSGQLGRRLAPRLLMEGYDVRAHYRSAEKARKYCPPEAHPVIGDLLHSDWLDDAVAGCQIVIHGAARVSLRQDSHLEQYRVNVQGTRAVIEACRRNNVKRLINISSIVSVGASTDNRLIDETAPFNLGGYGVAYFETKHEAERIALDANSAALEVISINPSIMISAPDRELTDRDLRKIPKFIPAYFDFGLNLVETEDVISGIVAAISKGRPGQRYLLTGENIDPQKLFGLAQKYFGIKKPFLKIPYPILFPIAWLITIAAKLRGKRPRFYHALAKVARLRFHYSYQKAASELGYSPCPLNETIERILPSIKKKAK